jgi:hypothetical protein
MKKINLKFFKGDGVGSWRLTVAGYELRVASCRLPVAGCRLCSGSVAGYLVLGIWWGNQKHTLHDSI